MKTRSFSLQFLAASLLVMAPGCGPVAIGAALGSGGGGGGGSAPPTFALNPILTTGQTAWAPGQVLVADVNDPTKLQLATDAVYDTVWKTGDTQAATAKARPVSNGRLALVVPAGLAAGPYNVDFEVKGGTGRILCSVAASTPVTSASAYVAAVRSEFGQRSSALRVAATADPDVPRRIRTLADLDRIDAWLAAFDASLPALAGPGVQVLANVLAANSPLRAQLPTSPTVSLEVIQKASSAAEDLAGVALAALVARTTVVAPAGAEAELQPLLAASLQIGGLLALVGSFSSWQAAVDRPFKPISALVVRAPTPDFWLANEPIRLSCSATLGSLAASDRSDPLLVGVFADLDSIAAILGQLRPSELGLISSRAPTAAASPIIGTGQLDPTKLELLAQNNPNVSLSLAASVLRATFSALTTSVTTLAIFRYREDSLGAVTTTTPVLVVPVPGDMAPAPAGSFVMGNNLIPEETPAHEVIISSPFWMAKFETTQAQYQALMGANPSGFTGANRPVTDVTWSQARAYCDALSVQEMTAGRLPPGYEYRLPTEAEWEYCCRAGTTTAFNVGTSLTCNQATITENGSPCNAQPLGTTNVGQYPANAWGLHDMHGNAWEWCLDYVDALPATYPVGPVPNQYVMSPTFINRVVRGGSYFYIAFFATSSYRGQQFSGAGTGNPSHGFRVVLAPPAQSVSPP